MSPPPWGESRPGRCVSTPARNAADHAAVVVIALPDERTRASTVPGIPTPMLRAAARRTRAFRPKQSRRRAICNESCSGLVASAERHPERSTPPPDRPNSEKRPSRPPAARRPQPRLARRDQGSRSTGVFPLPAEGSTFRLKKGSAPCGARRVEERVEYSARRDGALHASRAVQERRVDGLPASALCERRWRTSQRFWVAPFPAGSTGVNSP